MIPRKPRAKNGDVSSWGTWTRREFEKYSRIYKAAAFRDKQLPERPDERWLAEHLLSRKTNDGRSFIRKYARNIGHFLIASGEKNLVDGKLVRAVLNAPDDVDPFALDLDSADLPFSLGRAQSFVDDSYTPETYAAYTSIARRWKKRCDGLKIDWLRPPDGALEEFFEECAVVDSYSTIGNRRNALSHHFRRHDVPDIARAPSIERILDGVKRRKAPRRIRPATPEMRSAILAEIEDEGVGIRDRCCVLITSFSHLAASLITLIDVEQCAVTDEGVTIIVPGEPPVFIGRHDDRDLNLVYWLRRLLALVPPTGPLFRVLLLRRMRFGDERLSREAILQSVQRAAQQAGFSTRDLSSRLRELFAIEVQREVQPVVFYYGRNRRTLPSDASAKARSAKLRLKKAYRAADGR